MHILFTITSLSSGGAERVTTNLSNEWIKRGYEVTIVTIASKKDDFYELNSKINRIGLNLDNNSANPLQAIIANTKRIISIRKVLKKIKPDFVIGMMPVSAVLTIIASMGLKNRIIACERNYPPMSELNRFWAKLRRITYPKAAVVTAQTSEIAKWIKDNIKARVVEVIPNPIVYPLPKNNPIIKPESIVAKEDLILLAVGELKKQKGFDLLISAFCALHEQFSEWKLVIIGDGKMKPTLENLINERKLQNKILLPGRAGNIADWYNRADIYVMSSRFEGFPNTLAEAMAHGCPVISYNCPTGPRDLIDNYHNGILTNDLDSINSLTNDIKTLMSNRITREMFSKNAIEVRHNFSLDIILQKWDMIFSSFSCEKI